MTDRNGAEDVLKLRPGSVSWKVIDDEAILLDIEASEYIGMNTSATLLLQALDAGATELEMVASLQRRFDLEPGIAAHDVHAFIHNCRAKGWLEH
jgi:hypothetical protein